MFREHGTERADESSGDKIRGSNPAAGVFLELGDEAHQEGEEGVGKGDLLAVEEDDVAPTPGADAGDVEAVAAEVTVAFVVGELGRGQSGRGDGDPGRDAVLKRGGDRAGEAMATE
jgi:hypothetical protein